jgi:pyrimidine-specific ribonucleoside hydrolase
MRPTLAPRLSRTRSALALVTALALITACGESASTTTTTVATTSTTVPVTPATTTTSATTTTTTTAAPGGIPVVVDTDMAAEGMMSILYLLASPDLSVRAITVSGTGLVHCEPGVRQALGLVELARVGDVPVSCGPEQPLDGQNAFPTSWRIGADDLYGVELPTGGQSAGVPAPELLASVIGEASGPVVVYTDGPFTNLAAAFRLDPAIVANISMVYAMGGAIDVPGNAIRNPDAEWNVWVDPVAAAEVFASGVPLTLVPLDATNQVPLNVFHLRALEAHQATPGAAAVVTALAGNAQLAEGGLYFWDQLTAAFLVDESLAGFETMSLRVVTEGERDTAGRIQRAADGASVRVATTVDAVRFEQEFLSALAGEDVGPIVMAADITALFDGAVWSPGTPATLAAGDYVVSFANSSGGDAVFVFGHLVGEGTEADLMAWESLDQPPFLEVDGYAYAAPGSTTVAVISLTEPGTHYVIGLDFAAEAVSTLESLEVVG